MLLQTAEESPLKIKHMSSELVADCPRCDSKKITFDLLQRNHVDTQYGWQLWFEAFCVCRHCGKSTVFVLSQKVDGDRDLIHSTPLHEVEGALNTHMQVEDYISLKNLSGHVPPEHLPEAIEFVFDEGATCVSCGCYNAAVTMFRLCVDLATKPLLPVENTDGLTSNIRRSLGLRLVWLFDQKRLPEGLRELSSCIKEDGNDGAHAGTLKKEDAEDILDFTFALLERLYTEPQRLRIAKERRAVRRGTGTS